MLERPAGSLDRIRNATQGGLWVVQKVNVAEKFGRFQEYWKPKIIGELNDSYVKAVKLKGEFVWHEHEQEDELFFVTKGRLLIKLRDGDIHLATGSSSSSRAALSICPLPTMRSTRCWSRRRQPSIREPSPTSGRSPNWSGSRDSSPLSVADLAVPLWHNRRMQQTTQNQGAARRPESLCWSTG